VVYFEKTFSRSENGRLVRKADDRRHNKDCLVAKIHAVQFTSGSLQEIIGVNNDRLVIDGHDGSTTGS
jgi:hypothetical protein